MYFFLFLARVLTGSPPHNKFVTRMTIVNTALTWMSGLDQALAFLAEDQSSILGTLLGQFTPV